MNGNERAAAASFQESVHDSVSRSLAGVLAVANTAQAGRARQSLDRAKRIAVVTKFRFMGDSIVATPFLTQLHELFPNAEVTLFTAPSVVTALTGGPDVDSLVPVEMSGRSRMRHSRELYGMLRSGGFDVAFLLNRSLHCAAICAMARIPIRVGYINEMRRPFLTVPIPYFFDRNEVDCHLDMLRALGLPVREELPTIWISGEERKQALKALREYGWQGGRPIIGIQPGANDPGIREWGALRFAAVANDLVRETGGQVALMGGTGERACAERVSRALEKPPVDLVGALPLREALAAIGQCDLWLGNDTGLLHAAVAQRVASVGIFGPNKVVRWGYSAPRHRSLVSFPQAPARDDATVRCCIDEIGEELVLKTCREVLRAPAESADGHTDPPKRAPYFAATLTRDRLTPARRR